MSTDKIHDAIAKIVVLLIVLAGWVYGVSHGVAAVMESGSSATAASAMVVLGSIAPILITVAVVNSAWNDLFPKEKSEVDELVNA